MTGERRAGKPVHLRVGHVRENGMKEQVIRLRGGESGHDPQLLQTSQETITVLRLGPFRMTI